MMFVSRLEAIGIDDHSVLGSYLLRGGVDWAGDAYGDQARPPAAQRPEIGLHYSDLSATAQLASRKERLRLSERRKL